MECLIDLPCGMFDKLEHAPNDMRLNATGYPKLQADLVGKPGDKPTAPSQHPQTDMVVAVVVVQRPVRFMQIVK